MEIKLEALIEQIKRDGVDQAKLEALEIIEAAKLEALEIVKTAQLQAEKCLKESQQTSSQFEANTRNSLQQAFRDTILKTKNQLNELFEKTLKRSVEQELNPEFMKTLILEIAKKFQPQANSELEVLVNSSDKDRLTGLLLAEIKKDAESKITIKASQDVTKGFLIGIQGSDVYYEFSEESIAEILKKFINPVIVNIVDKK